MNGKKILIVEDEHEVRARLCGLIKKAVNPEIIDEACNGDEAIAKILGTDYDLVILDIRMPGRNGLDVIREVKRVKKALPPTLVVTGHDSDQVASEIIAEGISDYIPKPVDMERFIKAVQTILDGKGKSFGIKGKS